MCPKQIPLLAKKSGSDPSSLFKNSGRGGSKFFNGSSGSGICFELGTQEGIQRALLTGTSHQQDGEQRSNGGRVFYQQLQVLPSDCLDSRDELLQLLQQLFFFFFFFQGFAADTAAAAGNWALCKKRVGPRGATGQMPKLPEIGPDRPVLLAPRRVAGSE